MWCCLWSRVARMVVALLVPLIVVVVPRVKVHTLPRGAVFLLVLGLESCSSVPVLTFVVSSPFGNVAAPDFSRRLHVRVTRGRLWSPRSWYPGGISPGWWWLFLHFNPVLFSSSDVGLVVLPGAAPLLLDLKLLQLLFQCGNHVRLLPDYLLHIGSRVHFFCRCYWWRWDTGVGYDRWSRS